MNNCRQHVKIWRRGLFLCVAAIAVAMVFLTQIADPSWAANEAPAPAQEWILQFGSSSYDYSGGIAADGDGNVYLVGMTGGALPGQASAQLYYDAFIRKIDSSGNAVWTRQFDSNNGIDRAFGVAVDDARGAVYVVGQASGILTAAIREGQWPGMFIRKYNLDGIEVWTRQFGTNPNETAYGVAVDGDGNAYVTGYVFNSLTGEPMFGGDSDGFVRKYDSYGNVVWTRQFGTPGSDRALKLALDGSGNVYVGGYVYPSDIYDSDIFVWKFDRFGNELWERQFGAPTITPYSGTDWFYGIAADQAGNAYVTGRTSGTLDGQVSLGSSDAFVRKYDADGEEVWTRQFGTIADDWPGGLAVDSSGNVHVAGNTSGVFPNQVGKSGDVFLRTYSASGDELSTIQFGSTGWDYAGGWLGHDAIALDGLGNVFIGGSTSGTFPGQTSSGDWDVFVAKLYFYNPNSSPTANAGGPYSVDENGSVTLVGSGDDADGDTLVFEWDLNNDGIFETPGQTVAFSAIGRDGPSTQTVTLRVSDNAGGEATSSTDVNILNVAPTVEAIVAVPSGPVSVNLPINISGSFTDPGVLDTHTAIWNWGDGTSSAGVVSEFNGSGSASGSHSYASPGVYTLAITVTDDDGGEGHSVFQYIVVYDAAGAFVTGAGTINSPVGAYAPEPLLEGRALFGFVSKYDPGKTLPTGQTQFRFVMAGMLFSSSSYDWLVVSGPRAQFKGSGTINGMGDYGFLLTAVDGQVSGGGGVDTFRIKIWDKATGSTIYDNQMGADAQSDPSTPIEGGNIFIHK